MTLYYGLKSKEDAVKYARAVVDVLGGGNPAVALLVETAAAETLLGQLKDPTPYAAGTGLTQVDKGTFDWLKQLYADHKLGNLIIQHFNIKLSKTQYQELETSPLLAMIFCRLRYYAVPTAIPVTLQGRAAYWKQWYNTSAGKGTIDDYLSKVAKCGVEQLLSAN